mgnify:CR=1 FL=1
MERARIIVKGRVQRVGYRDLVAEVANSLDIGGRAKNLPDGTVRIIAESEKDVLEKFISLIQPRDDPMIKVTGVDVKFEPASGEFEYFDIEYEDFDKEGFERIGVAAVYLKRLDKGQNKMLDKQDQMLEKQDQMLDKQDKMLEKQDQMLDKQDQMLDKQDQMLEKQDLTISEVKKVGEKVDQGFSKMDQNFTTLRGDYGKISDKIDSMDKTLKELTNAILKLAEKSAK